MSVSEYKYIPTKEFDPNEPVTIYLIGDLEGDITMITNWFVKKRLMSPNLMWNPQKNNVVVFQLGDQVDKYQGSRLRRQRHHTQSDEDDWKVVQLFDMLNDRSNGRVQSILGNHELMNVMGDFHYSGLEVAEDKQAFINKRSNYFRNPRSPVFQMLRKRPYLMYFRGLVLSHAGITPEQLQVAQDVYGVKDMEQFVKLVNSVPLEHWINTNIHTVDVNNPQWFVWNVVDEEFGGMVWNREYDHNQVGGALLRIEFAKMGVPNATMVIGHNVLHDVEVCTMHSCVKANKYDVSSDGIPSIIKVDTGKTSRKCDKTTNVHTALVEMNQRTRDIVSVKQETYVWQCDQSF